MMSFAIILLKKLIIAYFPWGHSYCNLHLCLSTLQNFSLIKSSSEITARFLDIFDAEMLAFFYTNQNSTIHCEKECKSYVEAVVALTFIKRSGTKQNF